jgi:hypothetical protein
MARMFPVSGPSQVKHHTSQCSDLVTNRLRESHHTAFKCSNFEGYYAVPVRRNAALSQVRPYISMNDACSLAITNQSDLPSLQRNAYAESPA